MNIYETAEKMEKLDGETKREFIKRYIDLVCSDYSRTGLKASSFYSWIYSMATYEAEIVIVSPREERHDLLKDEKGEYYVRKNLRPYEFKMLDAIASQCYAEKYEGAEFKAQKFSGFQFSLWLRAEQNQR